MLPGIVFLTSLCTTVLVLREDANAAGLSSLLRDRTLVALHHKWHATVRTFVAGLGYRLGNAGIVPQQAWDYLDAARCRSCAAARQDNNRTKKLKASLVVCETGFFQGVSAHLWLTANAHLRLHTFDVSFPTAAVAGLRKTFGKERLHTHLGPTATTLKAFQPKAPCDVLSVDGSHDGWAPYDDLVALLPNTRCGATVFFDDTFDERARASTAIANATLDNDPRSPHFFNACTRSYWRAVREGLLNHTRCVRLGTRLRWGKFPKGFCTARTAVCGTADATRDARAAVRGSRRARGAPVPPISEP